MLDFIKFNHRKSWDLLCVTYVFFFVISVIIKRINRIILICTVYMCLNVGKMMDKYYRVEPAKYEERFYE